MKKEINNIPILYHISLAFTADRAADILKADLGEPHARLAIELALRAQPLIDQ